VRWAEAHRMKKQSVPQRLKPHILTNNLDTAEAVSLSKA
jgi:hypothetical protein